MPTRDGVPFHQLCRIHGLPKPIPEFRFAPPRRWRFDFAWPDHLVALELEGGAFTQGRHTRPTGFLADMEKYNSAQLNGWIVLRCLPDALSYDATFELLRQAFTHRLRQSLVVALME
jgi:hypothetical protein